MDNLEMAILFAVSGLIGVSLTKYSNKWFSRYFELLSLLTIAIWFFGQRELFYSNKTYFFGSLILGLVALLIHFVFFRRKSDKNEA